MGAEKTPETPHTSQYYGIEGFTGGGG